MGVWYITHTKKNVTKMSPAYIHQCVYIIGNELSGSGIGASVAAEQYGKDVTVLRDLVDELYKKSRSKPLVLAPGGFFDQEWYTKLLQVSGPGVIDAMTHHIYNLGAGI